MDEYIVENGIFFADKVEYDQFVQFFLNKLKSHSNIFRIDELHFNYGNP